MIEAGSDVPRAAADGLCADDPSRTQQPAEIERLQERNRTLAFEVVAQCDRERRRIAQGLHDDVGQVLATARLRLGVLQRVSGDPGAIGTLDEIGCLIQSAIDSIRGLTFELAPPLLHELGLAPALRQLVRQVSATHELPCDVTWSGPNERFLPELETLAYGMVSELLCNVVKHAGATRASVRVTHAGDDLLIEVSDDGVGMSPEAVAGQTEATATPGHGLASVRERLIDLDGSMRVDGSAGDTRVRLKVPLRWGAERDR